MIALLPCLLAIVWAIVACLPAANTDFSRQRARMAVLLVASAGGTFAAWVVADALGDAAMLADRPLVWLAPGFLGVVPIVISVVGLVSVALADSISHSVSTLRRILLLLAVAMAFVASDEPVVLAVLWALSIVVAWHELRARGLVGTQRLLLVYQLPSVLLFGLAVGMLALDRPTPAAALGLAAFGLREAVIPVHSWFVRFVETAPLGLVVAFVGPQLGVHAHVGLLSSSTPDELAFGVGLFGALTAVVAAWLGLAQWSMRRSLAYLMISQTGLASFGLQGPSEVAFAGALVVWQVLALATSGFAMTVSALEARRGPQSLDEFSGCFARTPRMAAGFLMMGLASVGFPMTLGFVAEDLLVQGSVEGQPILAFVIVLATALNGMNVMRCFFRLFSGRRVHSGESDLTSREGRALSVVLLLLLVSGLAPSMVTSREFGGGAHAGTATPEHTAGRAEKRAPHASVSGSGIDLPILEVSSARTSSRAPHHVARDGPPPSVDEGGP